MAKRKPEGHEAMHDESTHDYVLKRYDTAIEYYWKASRSNKNAYKRSRGLVLILGALVTLAASLSSANFITSNPIWDTSFAIAAPVLAATLTIVGGFSQSFHWGAAWRDMVLNAARLEKERDRFRVTKSEDCDLGKELAVLNDLVLAETQNFFQRILGGAATEKEQHVPSKEK